MAIGTARVFGASQVIVAEAAAAATTIAATDLPIAVRKTDALASHASILQAKAETAGTSATVGTALLAVAAGKATGTVKAWAGAGSTLTTAAIAATILSGTIGHTASALIALHVRWTSPTIANRLGTTIELVTEACTGNDLDAVDEHN